MENSLKFTEEGGINLCVEARKESYGINLIIDIYDTGIGMTESQLVQMYDDFYQADAGNHHFVGGLGLSGDFSTPWAALSILKAESSRGCIPIFPFPRGWPMKRPAW